MWWHDNAWICSDDKPLFLPSLLKNSLSEIPTIKANKYNTYVIGTYMKKQNIFI